MDVKEVNELLECFCDDLVEAEAAKELKKGRGEKTVVRPKKASKLQRLKAKYMDAKTGRFKGKTGERFDNCVKYMTAKGDVEDPEAMCGKIARGKGMAPGGKFYKKG